jgi:serine/threonine-protein kinase
MVDDSRVQLLLEEIMDSGCAPEVACRSCPELLPAVLEGLARLEDFEAEVKAIFPERAPKAQEARARRLKAELPEIPDYSVLGVLGRGGMGVVYRAHHLKLARDVAVKMLLTPDHARPSEFARFQREARTIASLRHPHIIQVFDIGDLEGRPYFTMEFVEGGSLAQKLAGVPQSARDAAEMVATLADAVQVAHERGIVHRDLKPANILLTAEGTPKIGDFGLARTVTEGPELTVVGTRLGTPSYMSPEQAIGRRGTVGPSTDIYSLGAVLYEMLTGRPPFRAETPAETERQVIAADPAPPSRLNTRIPRDLETICLKCLSKEPQRRYATGTALAQDLRRFLRGEPIVARPVGACERIVKWTRRHPARTAAWLAGIVAVGAVLGTFLWTASRRAAIDRAVAEDLAQAIRLEESSDWRAARNSVARARTRLLAVGRGNRETLELQATAIERELDLVDRLSAMRFQRGAAEDVEFDRGEWWDAYREAFSAAGLLHQGDAPPEFAARIARSPIRTALVDAMDDWSICAPDEERCEWLLGATRLADPGSDWRQRARDSATWKSSVPLAALAKEAPVASEPVSLLLIIAGLLLNSDLDASLGLLRRTQAAHPSDFWANFALAESLDERRDPEAIGFYRAAIALRPEASAAHFNLGMALAAQKRTHEAVESLQAAVALDSSSWKSQYNLAQALGREARYEEALQHAVIAARIAPGQPVVHGVLGLALKGLGRTSEAAESFRRGLELSPEGSELRAVFAADLAKCETAGAGESQVIRDW